jgi:hypothetical protein
MAQKAGKIPTVGRVWGIFVMAPAWAWDPKTEGGGFLGREGLGIGGEMKGDGVMGKNKNVCGE